MRIGLATLALVLLLIAGPARADGYDETEYRLKTAGIDEDLRERIHAAIRRGVAHLRKFQKPDGSFGGNPGHTALAGLALRHAAIPDGVEGGRAAIRWLEKAGRSQHSMTTYGVGLLAMLLTADGSHEAWNKSLHARLAKGPRKDKGYWGYQPAGGRGPSNLSTAQFGCLGLWAGERAGAPSATKTWRLHLDALLAAQQPSGSWGYNVDPADPRDLGMGLGYPTGTFMGLADLALASAALREDLREDPKRWSRTLIASSAAHAALRRHVAWEVDSVVLPVAFATGNFFPFYRLYALEKVCIFVDLEDVAGRRWYEEGARRLLAAQARDGSWSSGAPVAWGFAPANSGSPIDTSFALLFLLRASHAYHPITPRPVDRSTAVITPGDDPLEPQPEVADPGPVISIETANQVLDTLEIWLGEKKLATPGPAVASFARVREIYSQFRPGGVPHSEPHDAWCRRAESALLKASTRFLESRPRYREHWHAVGLLALDTLAATDRRVTPILMRTIDRMPEHASFSGPVRFGWYSAAFDALRRLDAPALAAWIGQRMLSRERTAWPRTSAALTTLGGIRGLQGRQRHAAAKQVLDWLVAQHRRGGEEPRSRDLQVDGIVAMRRLARAGCDHFPVLQSVSTATLVQSAESWWKAHGAATDPAWAD